MARARNIKPGFFSNDVLAEIDPLGRLLFAGLWTIADREGRLEDRPKRIKAEVLPYDNCNIDELLQALNSKGFILRYSVDGNGYIQVLAWGKHQNPHIKESASTIPVPTEHSTSTVLGTTFTGASPADSLIPDSFNLIPDSLNPHPGENLSGDETEKQPELLPAIATAKPAPKKKPAEDDPLQTACRETWLAYATAYQFRYGVPPVRNARVSSTVKGFVKRVGMQEAPAIAAWFVTHPGAYYTGKMHDTGCLLADAEKLRTEWAAGFVMTAGKARQEDRKGGMRAALDKILAERGES